MCFLHLRCLFLWFSVYFVFCALVLSTSLISTNIKTPPPTPVKFIIMDSLSSVTGSSSSLSINPTATTTTATTAATTTTNSTNVTATITTTTSTSSGVTNAANTNIIPSSNSSNVTSVLVSNANAPSSQLVNLSTLQSQPSQLQHQQQQLMPIDIIKPDDANNSSLASAISEGQRSLSGAPSASSSPILSPPNKMFGRNANGTMIATSRPSNEAEIQLYRVLQRASLLVYYDTLLEMGGDDVQQLYEAGEEEFLEIMALVGMASKPLHVRRLQKVLHEWANNPSIFQGPMLSSNATAGFCETPTKSTIIFKPEPSPSLLRTKFPAFNPTTAFNPTPLISTAQTTSTHLLTQMCTPVITIPVTQQHTPTLPLPTTLPPAAAATTCLSTVHQAIVGVGGGVSGSTAHQVTSSSPQLTPVLTEMQIARITLGAEKIARQLPQREPRPQTSKKRTSRELEQVIAMTENDPRRMDEIRKYSAIYGRFDCKRRPEKPLTLHEVCVNEAAAQLCRLVPALLTRRDELFPLARQIVKDAGFGHSASIARYGGLLPQMQAAQQIAQPRSSMATDCESSDSASAATKRQRLSSTETMSAPDLNRESGEDSRYNLFAMYQKFAKPPFDLTEISKFSLSKSDFDDNDSRFSFSNSSSPPSMPNNCLENERDHADNVKFNEEHFSVTSQSCNQSESNRHNNGNSPLQHRNHSKISTSSASESVNILGNSPLGGVQVISAAGGHIIAVANPALVLSPTLNEALSLKREASSPTEN